MLRQLLINQCHILNTRPEPQATLNSEIIALGGKVTALPLFQIIAKNNSWELPALEKYDGAIFISKNAVTNFFSRFGQQAWPTKFATLAIGKATQAALAARNITAKCSIEATSESLLNLPILQKAKKILLIKGENGRDILQNTLKERGTMVECLEVYQRVKIAYPKALINEIWQDDFIDIILFTSNEALEHIFTLFKEFNSWLHNKPCVVISQRLARSARDKGIKTIFVTSPEEILQGLINAHKKGCLHASKYP